MLHNVIQWRKIPRPPPKGRRNLKTTLSKKKWKWFFLAQQLLTQHQDKIPGKKKKKKITTKTILSRQLMKTPNNCTCHRPWPPNKCVCWKQQLHSLSIFLSRAWPLICHQDTPCCRYICCIQPDTTSRKGNCMRKKEIERYHKKSQYTFPLEQQSPLSSHSLKRPSQRLIYIEQALSAKVVMSLELDLNPTFWKDTHKITGGTHKRSRKDQSSRIWTETPRCWW